MPLIRLLFVIMFVVAFFNVSNSFSQSPPTSDRYLGSNRTIEFYDSGGRARNIILYFHGTGVGIQGTHFHAKDLIDDGNRLIIVNRLGYGSTNIVSEDTEGPTECARVVRKFIRKKFRIGPSSQKLLLIATSGGSPCAIRFVDLFPRLVAGLILQSPVTHGWLDNPRFLPDALSEFYKKMFATRFQIQRVVGRSFGNRISLRNSQQIKLFFKLLEDLEDGVSIDINEDEIEGGSSHNGRAVWECDNNICTHNCTGRGEIGRACQKLGLGQALLSLRERQMVDGDTLMMSLTGSNRWSDVRNNPNFDEFKSVFFDANNNDDHDDGSANDIGVFLNWKKFYGNISRRIPVLLIHDSQDPVNPIAHSKEFLEELEKRHDSIQSLIQPQVGGHLLWLGDDVDTWKETRREFINCHLKRHHFRLLN